MQETPKGLARSLFEDFAVGDMFRSRLGRTVTQTDNVWFTCLTMNTNQMHFNDAYAERTRGVNQRGETVIEFRRTFMAYTRDAPESAPTFPEPVDPWTSRSPTS